MLRSASVRVYKVKCVLPSAEAKLSCAIILAHLLVEGAGRVYEASHFPCYWSESQHNVEFFVWRAFVRSVRNANEALDKRFLVMGASSASTCQMPRCVSTVGLKCRHLSGSDAM